MTKDEFLLKSKALGLNLKHIKGDLYQIDNYFFGNYDKAGELSITEDSFDIKHFKGYWSHIKFPEEIITHNYFEYYLGQTQGQSVPLPEYWRELYEQAGLFKADNDDFKKARMRSLLVKLEEHYSNLNGIKDMSFWEALAIEFPECIYTGIAYRAVLVCHIDALDKQLLLAPGYSWALNMHGIKEFVIHGDSYEKDEDSGFFLATGTIRGFSLAHLRSFFKKEHEELLTSFSDFKEEEVISLEVLSVSNLEFCKLDSLK